MRKEPEGQARGDRNEGGLRRLGLRGTGGLIGEGRTSGRAACISFRIANISASPEIYLEVPGDSID